MPYLDRHTSVAMEVTCFLGLKVVEAENFTKVSFGGICGFLHFPGTEE